MQLCNTRVFLFLNYKSPLAPLLHPKGARTSARQSGEHDELYSEKVPPFYKGRLGGIFNVIR